MMEISRAPIHSQGKKKMYLIKERSLFLKDPKIWRARAIQWGENFKEEGGKLCEPMWDSVLTFCGFHPWFPMHHCFPRQAIETRIFLPLSYHVRATDHKAVLRLPLSDGRWLTSTWEENLSHTYATVRPRKRWKSPSWVSLPSLLTEQSAFFLSFHVLLWLSILKSCLGNGVPMKNQGSTGIPIFSYQERVQRRQYALTGHIPHLNIFSSASSVTTFKSGEYM